MSSCEIKLSYNRAIIFLLFLSFIFWSFLLLFLFLLLFAVLFLLFLFFWLYRFIRSLGWLLNWFLLCSLLLSFFHFVDLLLPIFFLFFLLFQISLFLLLFFSRPSFTSSIISMTTRFWSLGFLTHLANSIFFLLWRRRWARFFWNNPESSFIISFYHLCKGFKLFILF